jgi:hypothetical protein
MALGISSYIVIKLATSPALLSPAKRQARFPDSLIVCPRYTKEVWGPLYDATYAPSPPRALRGG